MPGFDTLIEDESFSILEANWATKEGDGSRFAVLEIVHEVEDVSVHVPTTISMPNTDVALNPITTIKAKGTLLVRVESNAHRRAHLGQVTGVGLTVNLHIVKSKDMDMGSDKCLETFLEDAGRNGSVRIASKDKVLLLRTYLNMNKHTAI
ncbi:hypothetical protein V6N12_010532 [Hibiscus sabdariffa]|uniref:Uncharacterized protein n=1 Tax=Hibiscus sabdariffa TaxID=183260 RepID=A0ABR2EKC9_9ROSI